MNLLSSFCPLFFSPNCRTHHEIWQKQLHRDLSTKEHLVLYALSVDNSKRYSVAPPPSVPSLSNLISVKTGVRARVALTRRSEWDVTSIATCVVQNNLPPPPRGKTPPSIRETTPRWCPFRYAHTDTQAVQPTQKVAEGKDDRSGDDDEGSQDSWMAPRRKLDVVLGNATTNAQVQVADHAAQ